MPTHLNSMTGVPVCRYFSFHGNHSAVSSTKLPLCLAPTGISLKVKIFAYYSASSCFIMQTFYHKVYLLSSIFLKKIFDNTQGESMAAHLAFISYLFFVEYRHADSNTSKTAHRGDNRRRGITLSRCRTDVRRAVHKRDRQIFCHPRNKPYQVKRENTAARAQQYTDIIT